MKGLSQRTQLVQHASSRPDVRSLVIGLSLQHASTHARSLFVQQAVQRTSSRNNHAKPLSTAGRAADARVQAAFEADMHAGLLKAMRGEFTLYISGAI